MTSPTLPLVVVTGMGFITPVGHDRETVWSNLVEGVSGVGRITHFDTTSYSTDFDPPNYMARTTARNIGHYCQFALAASKMALSGAGSTPTTSA